jgi:hypothetical protein
VTVDALVLSGGTVPPTGGRSCFRVGVTNHEASAVAVDVWLEAAGPVAPRLLVTRFLRALTIPAGQRREGDLCQSVPGTIPDGTYVVTFAAGDLDAGTVYGAAGVQIVKGGLAHAATLEAAGAAPNPFRDGTRLRFALAEAADVTLTVHDALGREVARLVDGPLEAGAHAATFDARGLPSGVYAYRLRAGDAVHAGRLVRLR